MQNKNAILLFTKNPELGKVKTRLAKTIGNERALEIYKKLLTHTQSIASPIDADKFVFYLNEIEEIDLWSLGGYKKMLQCEGDLGEKMYNAFSSPIVAANLVFTFPNSGLRTKMINAFFITP